MQGTPMPEQIIISPPLKVRGVYGNVEALAQLFICQCETPRCANAESKRRKMSVRSHPCTLVPLQIVHLHLEALFLRILRTHLHVHGVRPEMLRSRVRVLDVKVFLNHKSGLVATHVFICAYTCICYVPFCVLG